MTSLRRLKRQVEYYPKRKFNSDSYLASKCTLSIFNDSVISNCENLFDCGDTDLNEFFSEDYKNYYDELFGKTYCFTDDITKEIVCAFSVSNDSIKNVTLPKRQKRRVRKNVSHAKHFIKSYPSVLVGRLGVSKNHRKLGIGGELMDFIKAWFISPSNKTGCRFIVVDAYNSKSVLNYYEKNGFRYLFNTEKEEIEYIGLDEGAKLDSRIMFFDLITLKAS